MRGDNKQQDGMFSYVSAEDRIPKDHPLRAIRAMVDIALRDLDRTFDRIYAKGGRPSIAPEKLLRALLLQMLYTIRSERQLMEQLDYNILFRWFVGLGMDDSVWDATVFTKNRERLFSDGIIEGFFAGVLDQARSRELLSSEHFTVDGTLIEAWAGQKSFKKKGKDSNDPPDDDPGNQDVNYRGEKRSNQTHQSTTDEDARLYRRSKGQEAKLCYLGHVLVENRNGLVMDSRVTLGGGLGERQAAQEMVITLPGTHRVTVGGDKAYDTREYVQELRFMNATPHVAQNDTNRRSAIDDRTTRHPGYAISQRKRKRVEEVFGWLKTVGMMRKTRHRGRERVEWMFTLATAAYNLVRMKNLALSSG